MARSTSSGELVEAIIHLTDKLGILDDADLGQPFRWGAHQEGIRFAFLGAMHELRTLAVQLAADRRLAGIPVTRAHHALAQYHAAYRDLEAVLFGVTDEQYNALPATGEWSLRYVYGHMVGAERNFFALVHYGVRRQREGEELSATLPEGEANRLLGPYEDFAQLMETGRREQMSAYYTANHNRALEEFAMISDMELDGPSVWWEGEHFSLEYRLHRMEAHLRQHTVQVEKTLDQIGRPIGEARRLVRLLFGALAEVESALIGAPELESAGLIPTAGSIRGLADAAIAAVGRANSLIAAVTGGDRELVRTLLAEDPQLANATSRDGVPVARLAVYYGQQIIAQALVESSGIELKIWDGAALGRLATVEESHRGGGNFILNEYSRDGYTPLQLACFFGHEEVARYLVDNGADIHAVSKNPMAIQPLHAAAAGDHLGIVRLLLEAGADPNAIQQDSFRPLHAAAQNGNSELTRLLLEYGADPELTDDQGRVPRIIAEAAAHDEVAALLS
jgi:ankyrin repeat protein